MCYSLKRLDLISRQCSHAHVHMQASHHFTPLGPFTVLGTVFWHGCCAVPFCGILMHGMHDVVVHSVSTGMHLLLDQPLHSTYASAKRVRIALQSL